MAFGAVGERVHACKWETGPAMNLERLHVVPSPRRMATAASSAQSGLVRIAVTVAAVSRHTALAAVALVACRRIVSPGEREAGPGMIETLPRLPRAHFPTRRGVAVSAIDSLGDRVVTAGLGPGGLPFGVLGHRNASDPGEDSNAEPDDHRAAHRFPFLRACGLP
jgi:hypothetical protein